MYTDINKHSRVVALIDTDTEHRQPQTEKGDDDDNESKVIVSAYVRSIMHGYDWLVRYSQVPGFEKRGSLR
eukprot:m.105366 g.105366  ORF g.105366 m.105366 type:complete len:71 (-) comp27640_c6_seq1:358-570(-)